MGLPFRWGPVVIGGVGPCGYGINFSRQGAIMRTKFDRIMRSNFDRMGIHKTAPNCCFSLYLPHSGACGRIPSLLDRRNWSAGRGRVVSCVSEYFLVSNICPAANNASRHFYFWRGARYTTVPEVQGPCKIPSGKARCFSEGFAVRFRPHGAGAPNFQTTNHIYPHQYRWQGSAEGSPTPP